MEIICLFIPNKCNYCQVSNIRRTLAGYKIVDHSDVVWASPVGAAPTTSSFSTKHLASLDWAKTAARQDTIKFGVPYIRYFMVVEISDMTKSQSGMQNTVGTL